ncbi:UDP-2,3-diacylglucosamine diphosphatase [Nitrosophilus alvini]|uniref:UDP-2,3-diacylglucosamine diphosphatase n=1 Tax=Nitrosophilus alvini TaxID=2714855 RepID=UPI00190A50B8|nr:metallophosphoesterase [Nitrosophilus alvini]
MSLELKEGALFISDAHLRNNNKERLKTLLEKIEKKEFNPSQIFWMGDIFDLLVAPVRQTVDENSDILRLMDKIALNIQSFYFEGNHDFALEKIFKNIKVFKRREQPQYFFSQKKRVAISHGDRWTTKRYELYINTIQNPLVLNFLSFLNRISNNAIVRRIECYNNSKNLCRKIERFEKIIEKRAVNYKGADIIIEGHFHQNRSFKIQNSLYYNLPAFVCKGEYAVFEKGVLRIYRL